MMRSEWLRFSVPAGWYGSSVWRTKESVMNELHGVDWQDGWMN